MTTSDNRTEVQPQEAAETRAVWERPELRRMDAGSAEAAVNAGVDNVVFS